MRRARGARRRGPAGQAGQTGGTVGAFEGLVSRRTSRRTAVGGTTSALVAQGTGAGGSGRVRRGACQPTLVPTRLPRPYVTPAARPPMSSWRRPLYHQV